MNLVKELIKAKGLTEIQAAKEVGVGYHSFFKTINKTPYTTKSGEVKFRECRHIREKIADWLGYPYDLIWGPDADHFLKKLIAEEMERRISQQIREKTRQKLRALGIL